MEETHLQADKWIFVFGSNLAGLHGKGAALFAKKYRYAQEGVGAGLTRKAYALPTKDRYLRTLPLSSIDRHINGIRDTGKLAVAPETFGLLRFAESRPDLTFQVTRVGCGLAGYGDQDIEPLFRDVPENVLLPGVWLGRRNRFLKRFIVAGSRNFEDYDFLKQKLGRGLARAMDSHYAGKIRMEIVSGAARGVDMLGERFAREHDIPLVRMPADWDRYGKQAGYVRNEAMAWYGTSLIAFWDGKSPGTKSMIDIAKNSGLETSVIEVTGHPTPEEYPDSVSAPSL